MFAAHFTLSHAAWLLTYPLAGWLGAKIGLSGAATVLSVIAILGLIAVLMLWPSSDGAIEHSHEDLAEDDPHFSEGHRAGARRHTHPVIIDRLHPEWPDG